MMCACDEEFGEKFLAHQLREGTELETQVRIPVTHGFLSGICPECRGLPPVTAPMAAIPGRTSKIKRYYWRELFFAVRTAQAMWDDEHPRAAPEDRERAHAQIEREVLDEIKQLHASTPRYTFTELSQAEVIERYGVEVEALSATYARAGAKGAQIVDEGTVISPEEFTARHYRNQGWSVLPLESVPFHVLFGVMLWTLIQDPRDPLVRMVGFGCRAAFEDKREGDQNWTHLPSDFGSLGYSQRRAEAIDRHFEQFIDEHIEWLFDYWVPHSERLRQYLWAHRPEDVERACELVAILPTATLIEILRYLLDGYWEHYLGWPDLLLHREGTFTFVEVKSSSDKLSEEQKRWIADNHDRLQLPFRVLKIHRTATI